MDINEIIETQLSGNRTSTSHVNINKLIEQKKQESNFVVNILFWFIGIFVFCLIGASIQLGELEKVNSPIIGLFMFSLTVSLFAGIFLIPVFNKIAWKLKMTPFYHDKSKITFLKRGLMYWIYGVITSLCLLIIKILIF